MSSEDKVIANIRNIINEQGLKQKAVAEKCGLTVNQFSALLNRRKTLKLDDLINICSVLNVNIDDVIDQDRGTVLLSRQAGQREADPLSRGAAVRLEGLRG